MNRWLRSVSCMAVTSAGVDPAGWQVTSEWEEVGGGRIEITAPCVWPFELPSLLAGLLEMHWGPLDIYEWVARHSTSG